MKKENIYKLLYLISILLLMGFVIRIGVDYFKYDVTTSFPFYAYIIVRTLEFLLPSVIIFIVAKVIKKTIKK